MHQINAAIYLMLRVLFELQSGLNLLLAAIIISYPICHHLAILASVATTLALLSHIRVGAAGDAISIPSTISANITAG